jgi:carboxypeptidase Q
MNTVGSRRGIRLHAACAIVVLLIGALGIVARSSALDRAGDSASDDTEAKRIAAVAGAGMIGSHAFAYLTELSDNVGARVTGSPEAAKAIEWGLATMRTMGLENVHAEKFQIWRGWTRGMAEAELIAPTRRRLTIDAMGWVGSTPVGGVDADVVQVDLGNIDVEMVSNSAHWAGKILEVTRKGPAPDRAAATEQFGKFGTFLEKAHDAHAVAVIGGQGGAKAMGIKLTHTGILGFKKYFEIPVVSMANEDQAQLERLMDAGKTPRLHINVQNTVTAGPVDSANVVGEIRGTEHPEQIIVVGGHLDSWDLAQGTTDNGCGSATTLGAADAILRSGMKPKRTIRFVLFTGEEQGLLGSLAYVEQHRTEMANHLGDIVLDSGQGAVTGVNLGGRDDLMDTVVPFAKTLGSFGVHDVNSEPSFGTDTGPFTLAGLPGIGLNQDTEEYQITHHSAADTLDKVDESILAKNAAIEAVLAFWIADRTERLATPWPAERTKKMLLDKKQDGFLKIVGIWPFGN